MQEGGTVEIFRSFTAVSSTYLGTHAEEHVRSTSGQFSEVSFGYRCCELLLFVWLKQLYPIFFNQPLQKRCFICLAIQKIRAPFFVTVALSTGTRMYGIQMKLQARFIDLLCWCVERAVGDVLLSYVSFFQPRCHKKQDLPLATVLLYFQHPVLDIFFVVAQLRNPSILPYRAHPQVSTPLRAEPTKIPGTVALSSYSNALTPRFQLKRCGFFRGKLSPRLSSEQRVSCCF
jgi:hypothetical protein